MGSESSARNTNPGEDREDRIELSGLEEFFTDNHEELFAKGLSIKQAVFYYGETRRSLRAKVESGEIPAIRLPESLGRKWRVFPDGVPPQLVQYVPKKLRKAKAKEAASKDDSNQSEALIALAEKPVAQSSEEDAFSRIWFGHPDVTDIPGFDEQAQLEEQVALVELEEQNQQVQIEEPVQQAQIEEPIQQVQIEEPIQQVQIEEPIQQVQIEEPIQQVQIEEPIQQVQIEEPLQQVQIEEPIQQVQIEEPLQQVQLEEPVALLAAGEPQALAPAEPAKKSARYNQLQDRVNELEKKLADAMYRSNYLETRISGLEDQVKFLTQYHYQSRKLNKLMMIVPVVAAVIAIVALRLTAQL